MGYHDARIAQVARLNARSLPLATPEEVAERRAALAYRPPPPPESWPYPPALAASWRASQRPDDGLLSVRGHGLCSPWVRAALLRVGHEDAAWLRYLQRRYHRAVVRRRYERVEAIGRLLVRLLRPYQLTVSWRVHCPLSRGGVFGEF